MKNIITIIIAVALSLIAGSFMFGGGSDSGASTQETAFERVMRTGVIRCGYLASLNFVDIDPNTGEMSGITVDYVEQMASNLGLKVEWTEEIGRGDYIAALQSNRFDTYCTANSVNAERSREVDFTDPYIFDQFDIYVREGVTRFDYNLSALNDPDVTFVVVEGDVFEKITRKFFPEAETKTLPQLTQESEQFMYVDTGKADALISTPYISKGYIDNNPDRIREVELGRPFVFANVGLSIKANEYRLRRMFDLATMEMHGNGQLDAILDKYDPDKLLGRRDLPFSRTK